MFLPDLNIKRSYRSSVDDFAADFFVPVLRVANNYDRAVGYFSSGSLYSLSRGLFDFSKNGGKIRLIASPYLTEEDFMAIEQGYKTRDEVVVEAAIRGLSDEQNFKIGDRLNFLAHLIKNGVLDIRIAFMKSGRGLYHEKIGLISDSKGNEIAFSGSLNETNQAFTQNFESIEVFRNWHSVDDKDRINDKRKEFEDLWLGQERGVCTRKFEAVERALMEKYFRKTEKFENFDIKTSVSKDDIGVEITLRDYQKEAIKKFIEQDGCGIFDMATGTGKTFTALGAIVELKEKLKNYLGVVIVVPYKHLVEQWAEEVKKFAIRPIIAYSDSHDSDWPKHVKNAVSDLQQEIGENPFFCIITTNTTFCLKKFQQNFWQRWMPENIMIVIDEAHNFGAENRSKYLDQRFRYRLALSATLDRHHDEYGTLVLRQYFGEVCISYDLEKAIKDHMLTPYEYYPVFVSMTEQERMAYIEITKIIGSGIRKSKDGSSTYTDKAKMAMIERSNLVATISGKVPALIEQLKKYKETHKDKGHILIYCGSASKLPHCDEILQSDSVEKQINIVIKNVSNLMSVARYTADTSVDERKRLKEDFSKGEHIQAIVAIKCLDEGIDIRSIRTAFILASTTNPKEYIQRRGRVLRLAEGKNKAEIYDFITLPYSLSEMKYCDKNELLKFRTLINNEMERYNEFNKLALNEVVSGAAYLKLCAKFGINVNKI